MFAELGLVENKRQNREFRQNRDVKQNYRQQWFREASFSAFAVHGLLFGVLVGRLLRP